MFTLIINEKGQAERRQSFEQAEVLIGRVEGNDLVLPKGNVSKRHARLSQREGRLVVIDENSANGTYVNRRRITQATLVRAGDRLYIGDYTLRIAVAEEGEGQRKPTKAPDTEKVLSAEQASFVKHQELVFEEEAGFPAPPRIPSEAPLATNTPRDSEAPERPAATAFSTLPAGPDTTRARTASASAEPLRLRALVEAVASKLGPGALDAEINESLRRRVEKLVHEQLERGETFSSSAAKADLIAIALDELLEFGPLTGLLLDDTVTRVTVNGTTSCVVFRGESCTTIEPAFSSLLSLERCLERLCRASERPLLEGERFVSRSFASGFRLFALCSASKTPELLSLVRARRVETSLDDLQLRGVISEEIATFLRDCVSAKVNLLVVGGALDVASELVCALALAVDDSWIAVEDWEEFLPHHPRIARLEAAKVTSGVRETLAFAARVSHARPLVENFSGAVGAATLDALAQGAEGVIARTVAPSIYRALIRLPADIAASGIGYDLASAREALVGAFQLVLEIGRLHDGSERVLRVCELQRAPDGAINAVDIFAFVVQPHDDPSRGSFVASGREPEIVDELRARGIPIHDRLFKRGNMG